MRQPIKSHPDPDLPVTKTGTSAVIALNQARATAQAAQFLLAGEPAVAAFAPARLDVLGGIADYSGATVLELPLNRGVVAIAQHTADGMIQASTFGPTAPDVRPASLPSATLFAGAPGASPERLRAALQQLDAGWAAYVLGPVAMLVAERLLQLPLDPGAGLRIAVWSNVPPGAGVASSAALELATLRAVQALYAPELDELTGLILAALAQRTEHRVALAPCGIMDQATSALGLGDHLLMLRCQPHEVLGHHPLPPGVRVLGIDSGVAHRVAAGQYGRVRTAAFMGRQLISMLAAAGGHEEPAGGYLCNLDTVRFEEKYASRLPEDLLGAEYHQLYGDHGDPATTVEPHTHYRIRDSSAHPIYEAANVKAFLAALADFQHEGDPSALVVAGDAMYRSHASYGARCGLGTPETDLLVELARDAGPERGVYGARVTGGGAGGTVAVLVTGAAGEATVHTIAAEYAQRTGHRSDVFTGSTDGAVRVPPLRFTPGRRSARKAVQGD